MRTLKTSESAASSLKLSTLFSSSLVPPKETLVPSINTPQAATAVQKSPWHSPVPYLFGGLAAMLGLIAFALLLLACSYWRLSAANNSSNNREENGDGRDVEVGDGKPQNAAAVKVMPIFEEKIVVIMAGDIKPTFLATPKTNKEFSSGDGTSSKNNESLGKGTEEVVEKPKFEVSYPNIDDNHDDVQTREEAATAVGDSHEVITPELDLLSFTFLQ